MHFVFFVIILLVGIIDIFVIFYYAPLKYNMIWIMPLSYVCFSIIFNRVYSIFGKSIVATLLLFMMILKNVVIPFLMAMGEGLSLVVIDTSRYLPSAYFLCIYEMLVVFLVIYIKTPGYLYYCVSKEKNIMHINRKSVKRLLCIMLILFSAFVAVILKYPQMLMYYDYGFLGTEEERIVHRQISEQISFSLPRVIFYFYTLLFDLLRWLIPITFIFLMYISKRIKTYVFILVSMILITISSLLSTDYRAASLFILISLFLLLTKLCPQYRKKLYMICFIGIFVLGFCGLVYKAYDSENIQTVAYNELANLLQAYFSGPENVAVGYMMHGYPTFEVFIGDVFKFVPFVMYFFKDFNTSMLQFNQVFFNEPDITTQIIPMITQSQRYFGVLGAPLFTFILCTLAFRQEFKSMRTVSFITYSVNIMLCVFLSIGIIMYCLSQYITIFMGTFLPIVLILNYVDNLKK